MERWARVFTIAAAGVMVAGPVFAQSGGGNTTTPKMGAEQPKPSGVNEPAPGAKTPDKSDAATPGTAGSGTMRSSPSAAPRTGSSMDTDKSDATKPSSEHMKSGSRARASGAKSSHAAGAKSDQIRSAQESLKDKGHDPGPIDGIMGPRTQAALREFQKAEGIQMTGRLDAETMSKLGVASPGSRTSGTNAGSPAASPETSGAASPGMSGSSSSGASSASDTSKERDAVPQRK